MQTLLKKWWVILIQGILMILLAFLVMSNPISTLAGISFWISTLVILIGAFGVAWWFNSPREERETSTLIWSIVTVLVGILMTAKLNITMITLSVLFGIMLLANGYHLVKNGWESRAQGNQAWLVIVVGVLSIICGLMSVFNVSLGAVAISTLLGYQLLLAGIALIILAFMKKRVGSKLEKAAEQIRSKYS
jgi:uncharacterized membrane protein HdeD (DUF308 family)